MSGSMNLGILPYLAYNIYKIFNLGEALSNSRRQKIIKEKISTKICVQFTIEGSHMFMKDIKYAWMWHMWLWTDTFRYTELKLYEIYIFLIMMIPSYYKSMLH